MEIYFRLVVELSILICLLWLILNFRSYFSKREEEPDYLGKFENLAGDALLDILEKRKLLVDKTITDELPLEEMFLVCSLL